MKKKLQKAILLSVVAISLLPFGTLSAYGAEQTPTVTFNGEPTDIRAKYIDDKFYFSLPDYWSAATDFSSPEEIQWNETEQTLTHNSLVISVKDRCWYRDHGQDAKRAHKIKFTEKIFYEDDTLWVAVSALRDLNPSPIPEIDLKGDILNFKRTFWQIPDGTPYKYRIPLIPLDEETGRPAFSKITQIREIANFNEDDFHILSEELEDGKTIFAYINRQDPQSFLFVTCVDGYVADVLDHSAVLGCAVR